MRNVLWFLAGGVVIGGAVAAFFVFMGPHRGGREHARNDEPVTRASIEAKQDARFVKLDADGDGNLSKAEWSALALSRFDAADTNHDGTLTKDEMEAARKANKGKADDDQS